MKIQINVSEKLMAEIRMLAEEQVEELVGKSNAALLKYVGKAMQEDLELQPGNLLGEIFVY